MSVPSVVSRCAFFHFFIFENFLLIKSFSFFQFSPFFPFSFFILSYGSLFFIFSIFHLFNFYIFFIFLIFSSFHFFIFSFSPFFRFFFISHPRYDKVSGIVNISKTTGLAGQQRTLLDCLEVGQMIATMSPQFSITHLSQQFGLLPHRLPKKIARLSSLQNEPTGIPPQLPTLPRNAKKSSLHSAQWLRATELCPHRLAFRRITLYHSVTWRQRHEHCRQRTQHEGSRTGTDFVGVRRRWSRFGAAFFCLSRLFVLSFCLFGLFVFPLFSNFFSPVFSFFFLRVVPFSYTFFPFFLPCFFPFYPLLSLLTIFIPCSLFPCSCCPFFSFFRFFFRLFFFVFLPFLAMNIADNAHNTRAVALGRILSVYADGRAF